MSYADNTFSPSYNLRRLFVLRNTLMLVLLGALGFAIFVLHAPLSILLALSPLAILAGVNLWTWRKANRQENISNRDIFIQILTDVIALTIFLYFTGGSTNPFVFFLLLPLVISAAALPERLTWITAAVTVSCYTGLMLFHRPLVFGGGSHEHSFALHITGMWIGFVFSALVVSYFVVRISHSLRERDQVLAQVREQTLRDERLVALGTLAAGTAHELGTPLSTIAILATEIEREHADDEALMADLTLLRKQVKRCKEALNTLSASAGQLRAESGQLKAIDRFITDVINDWQSMRPGIEIRYHVEGVQPPPLIIADQTLSQAIVNILNNAADVSPDEVEILAQWTTDELMLEVMDRGNGLAPEVQANAGNTIASTKGSQGLGMGLFIAHSVIKRLGGNIRLYNREGGGACARLHLPLKPLQKDTHVSH